MEAEHCIRKDGGEFRYLLHQIKKNLDKGRPDDTSGVTYHNMLLIKQLKPSMENSCLWTLVFKDLDQIVANGKLKKLQWSVQTLLGTVSVSK